MNDDRKKQLKSIVKRIASITTKIVPTGGGIELRFINAKTTDEMSKPNVTKVDEIIDSARFRGETPIGTRLKQKVLEDLVYAPLREDRLNRPILVSIITDGEPTPEKPDYIQKVISECVRELDKKEYTKNGRACLNLFSPLLHRD